MSNNLLTEPYFQILAMDDEHPDGGVGFICNTCRRPLDNGPCPDHAPVDVPGLALVECEATPRHWAWVLAGDQNGYGIPCWACQIAEQTRARMEAERCQHWPWRRWRLTRWLAGRLYTTGITSNGGGATWGNDHNWCTSLPRFDLRPRPYVLGVPRETWRCWLIGRHRRGEEVGFGFCGKCVPWPCCGSIRVQHKAGCPEDV